MFHKKLVIYGSLLHCERLFPTKATAHFKMNKRVKEIKTEEDLATVPIRTHERLDLILLQLPSNHTNGTTPGASTPKAMVTDNDLAFGQS